MTHIAPIKDFHEAALNSRPGRLKRIVRLGAALGINGVDQADAMEAIEDAIWADGALPCDTPSQRRAWTETCDRALWAFRNAPDVIDLAEYRAVRRARDLIDRLPPEATFHDLVDALLSEEMLLEPRAAERAARGALQSLARPPVDQIAQVPGPDPFATMRIPPSEADLARCTRAIAMLALEPGADPLDAVAEHEAIRPAQPVSEVEEGAPAAAVTPAIAFDLDSEPGLLGDLARWSLAYAFRPIPEFAQLSALAVLAPLFSRRFATPTGLGLNLYLVGLATTGSGKEALIGAPQAALQAAGLGFLIGAGDFTSDSAIEVALRARPNFLAPIDEVGEFVGAAQHRNAASHSRTIRKALLDLHGKSRPDGRWSGKQKADVEHDKAGDPVFAPHLTILGASTGQGFFEALTEANLADGFINRLIVVQGGKPGDRNLDPARMHVPAELSAALNAAYEEASAGNLSAGNARLASVKPEMRIVPWADASATAQWSEVADWQDEAGDAGREGITGRCAANTQVIATLRALARNPTAPAVTTEDVNWAWEFVRRSVEAVERGARENMAGSEFESLVKATEAAIVKGGTHGVPRSVLLRARGVAKHHPNMVDAALRRLEETEVIYKRIAGGTGGRPSERIIARCYAGDEV